MVANYYHCKPRSILKAKRGRGQKNQSRWIAMKLSQDYSGQALKKIATHFGVKTYCTVSVTIARPDKAMEEDEKPGQTHEI